MTESGGIHLLGFTLSAWVYAPLLFLLWLIVFYSAKGVLFYALKKWGEKTKARWDLLIIKSLGLPLNIFILAGGLALLVRLLPLPPEFDAPAALAAKIITILALFLIFDRLAVQFLNRLAGKITYVDLSHGLIHALVRFAIFTFGLMLILDALDISITPLVASLGIGSLAVALGLQDTLANLFAGVYIVADQPIRDGDYVRLESGEEGFVSEIGWRNTRIVLVPDHVVIVPNHRIISSTLKNYSLPSREMGVPVEVGVDYQSDLGKVERVALEVAREVQKRVEGAVPEFEPVVRFNKFGDSGLNFVVVLRGKDFPAQFLIRHELVKALHARFKMEGIAFAHPLRTLDLSASALKHLTRSPLKES